MRHYVRGAACATAAMSGWNCDVRLMDGLGRFVLDSTAAGSTRALRENDETQLYVNLWLHERRLCTHLVCLRESAKLLSSILLEESKLSVVSPCCGLVTAWGGPLLVTAMFEISNTVTRFLSAHTPCSSAHAKSHSAARRTTLLLSSLGCGNRPSSARGSVSVWRLVMHKESDLHPRERFAP